MNNPEKLRAVLNGFCFFPAPLQSPRSWGPLTITLGSKDEGSEVQRQITLLLLHTSPTVVPVAVNSGGICLCLQLSVPRKLLVMTEHPVGQAISVMLYAQHLKKQNKSLLFCLMLVDVIYVSSWEELRKTRQAILTQMLLALVCSLPCSSDCKISGRQKNCSLERNEEDDGEDESCFCYTILFSLFPSN